MLRDVLIGLGALLVGGLLGVLLASKEVDGRLSACKDMTSAFNAMMPAVQLECGVAKGDVFITSPLFEGKRFSLDGKREI